MAKKNPSGSKPSYVRRLGLERAVKSGFHIFVKGRIQPSVALGMARKVVRELAEKACRTRVNKENALGNLTAKAKVRHLNQQKSKFNDIVNTMTNRQRTQWARAGYKGLNRKNIKALEKFMVDNPK